MDKSEGKFRSVAVFESPAGIAGLPAHTRPTNDTQKTSVGHGAMMAQSSGPFCIVFMSAVSPPRR